MRYLRQPNHARSRAAIQRRHPKLHSECDPMKRALFLTTTLLTALPPVIALAATVQSNLAITVTSPPPTPPPPPPSPGGGSLLPADRDASANWQMAGLLSVGGIPNRTTQCGEIGR